MEQHSLVALLKPCQPLAHKLASQRYDYEFDPADLEILALYDQVARQLPFPEDDEALEQAEHIFAESGLTTEEHLWLTVCYEMTDFLWHIVAQETFDPGVPRHPFRERLEAVEQMTMHLLEEEVLHLRDLDWLCLPGMAQENPLVLPLAEKLLIRRLVESAGGIPDTQVLLSPRQQMLLEFLHDRRDHFGLASLLPQDPRLPSQETGDAWISATVSAWKITRSFPADRRPGKWSISIDREQVDALWTAIAQATREGHLGKYSRVSTARPPAKNKPPRTHHVIEVFTSDMQKQIDVYQVRATLRELGVTWTISYYPKKSARASSPLYTL
jgi:hypothetical protein